MKLIIILFVFASSILAQTDKNLLPDIIEIANLTSEKVEVIPISNNEFTDVAGYHTAWMDLDINFAEELEAQIQYSLVFDKESKSFAFYFAYIGKAWSQIERAIFKVHDVSIVKPLIIGKRNILGVGYRLRQYFSTDWFELTDFLYQFITTGSVMINFVGLKWNLTTNIIPQTHKILFSQFYLKMMDL